MQSETNFQKSILLNLFRKFYGDKSTCRTKEDCISNEMSQKGKKGTGILNLIQNRFEVHGTWIYLPPTIRILELAK